jgi:hypothetical protein
MQVPAASESGQRLFAKILVMPRGGCATNIKYQVHFSLTRANPIASRKSV